MQMGTSTISFSDMQMTRLPSWYMEMMMRQKRMRASFRGLGMLHGRRFGNKARKRRKYISQLSNVPHKLETDSSVTRFRQSGCKLTSGKGFLTETLKHIVKVMGIMSCRGTPTLKSF